MIKFRRALILNQNYFAAQILKFRRALILNRNYSVRSNIDREKVEIVNKFVKNATFVYILSSLW